MYNVPVVFPGLRREESLLQIANSFEYLDSVMEDVFSRIQCQTAGQCQSMQSLNNRILVAAAKVEKLKQTKNKATNVFSVSKYPAEANLVRLSSVFPRLDNHNLHRVCHKSAAGLSLARFLPVVLSDSPNIVLVDAGRKSSKQTSASERGEEEVDLRMRHRQLESVSSLLVFENNNFVDQSAARRNKKVEEESKQELDEAPASILTGEQLEHSSALSFAYVPGATAVPEFDVPLTLPDLPDIATDVAYSHDLPSIAPSANIPELPTIVNTAASADGNSTAAGPPPPSTSGQAPPPPPAMTDTPAPPPPPPPPPPLAEGTPASAAPAPAPQPQQPSEESGRGDLLASIRNAGGGHMKLKSAKERKLEKKKKNGEEDASASIGGLFAIAALQVKLRMRREGISGKKNKGEDADQGSLVSVNSHTAEDDEEWT